MTYDLRQVALFGEATYKLLDRLGLTAGLRWYDWEEDKTFRSGGGFSNSDAQNQDVTVSSDGFTPRFMVSYEANDNVTMNAQVSGAFVSAELMTRLTSCFAGMLMILSGVSGV